MRGSRMNGFQGEFHSSFLSFLKINLDYIIIDKIIMHIFIKKIKIKSIGAIKNEFI